LHFLKQYYGKILELCTIAIVVFHENKYTRVVRVFTMWIFCTTHQHLEINHKSGPKLKDILEVKSMWIVGRNKLVWVVNDFCLNEVT